LEIKYTPQGKVTFIYIGISTLITLPLEFMAAFNE